MNKVLKDLPFVIAYLNDIIIFSKTTEEHLQQVFHKLLDAKTFNEAVQMSLFCQRN